MKNVKTCGWMLLLSMTLSLMGACSSDSNEDTGSSGKNAGIPFTTDLVAGGWKIVSSTSSKSDFRMGSKALFVENGACLGFQSMETVYGLNEGKMYTFYKGTDEPMFVYTLHSFSVSDHDTILNIRVNGTLDDNSAFDIVVKKFEEFPDWKNKNEQEFMLRYQQGKDSIAAGKNWAVVNTYTGSKSFPTDFIVMQILDAGSGNSNPRYTDMVAIHYQGRLLPSTSHPQGIVIDETFTGSYNPSINVSYKGKVSNFINGLATALMQMRRGSHCVVYIPYQQAYGSTSVYLAPAYSMLIFEIWLEDFWTK